MYQYNWLFEARSIGEFFKRLGIFILDSNNICFTFYWSILFN